MVTDADCPALTANLYKSLLCVGIQLKTEEHVKRIQEIL